MADPAKAPKRKTRTELEAELESYRAHSHERVEEARQAREREKAARAEHNDLKQRLALAEADNQRMRGYIARVQEDDVVREEMLVTGDPEGAQQLVPKRKPTVFGEPYPYMVNAGAGGEMAVSGYDRFARERERTPPRHWVTY